MGDKPRISHEVRAVHGPAQTREDGILIGGDDQPTVVCGSVQVGRRDPIKPGPPWLADQSRRRVVGHGGLEDRQTGLGQRDVNQLAALARWAGGPVTRIERRQHSLRGEHAGESVPDR